MKTILLVIVFLVCNFSISQIEEKIKYETELVQMENKTSVLATIGISLNSIALYHISNGDKKSLMVYGVTGLLFDIMAISSHINYRKRKSIINKIYLNEY